MKYVYLIYYDIEMEDPTRDIDIVEEDAIVEYVRGMIKQGSILEDTMEGRELPKTPKEAIDIAEDDGWTVVKKELSRRF